MAPREKRGPLSSQGLGCPVSITGRAEKLWWAEVLLTPHTADLSLSQTKRAGISVLWKLLITSCPAELKHCNSYAGKTNTPETQACCGMGDIKAWPLTSLCFHGAVAWPPAVPQSWWGG